MTDPGRRAETGGDGNLRFWPCFVTLDLRPERTGDQGGEGALALAQRFPPRLTLLNLRWRGRDE